MKPYAYLTRAYVEALGLPMIPITRLRNQGVVMTGTDDWLRPSGSQSFAVGVKHDGCLYEREPDGLAFSRLPTFVDRWR